MSLTKSHGVIYSNAHVNPQLHSIVLCDDVVLISPNGKYLGLLLMAKCLLNVT